MPLIQLLMELDLPQTRLHLSQIRLDVLLMRPYPQQNELNLFQTELEQQILKFCLERIELDEQQMKLYLLQIELDPSRMDADERLMTAKKCRLSSIYDRSSLICFSFDRSSGPLKGRRS